MTLDYPSNGGTVSVVEVKSYSDLNPDIRNLILEQLEDVRKRLNQTTVQYLTILSPATGYIKNIKTNKVIEFNTQPIVNSYVAPTDRKFINGIVLESVFREWLEDLISGERKLKTNPERELLKFGFIDNIRGTHVQTQTPLE